MYPRERWINKFLPKSPTTNSSLHDHSVKEALEEERNEETRNAQPTPKAHKQESQKIAFLTTVHSLPRLINSILDVNFRLLSTLTTPFTQGQR